MSLKESKIEIKQKKYSKQAGAELGQAQLKLGSDYNSINLYCTCRVDQVSLLNLFNLTRNS